MLNHSNVKILHHKQKKSHFKKNTKDDSIYLILTPQPNNKYTFLTLSYIVIYYKYSINIL